MSATCTDNFFTKYLVCKGKQGQKNNTDSLIQTKVKQLKTNGVEIICNIKLYAIIHTRKKLLEYWLAHFEKKNHWTMDQKQAIFEVGLLIQVKNQCLFLKNIFTQCHLQFYKH